MEAKHETSKSEPPETLKSSTNSAQPIHPDKKVNWDSPDLVVEEDDGEY